MAEIARRQHGVVADWQLAAIGIGTSGISRRVHAGRLHRLHRGVYAVGHLAVSSRREWMAAVIACGRRVSRNREHARLQGTGAQPARDSPVLSELVAVLDYWGAALSHRSAAQLWGLLSHREAAIDVSIPGHGGKKRRRGIRVHRTLTLLPVDVTLRDGIPVTTPARTIADLRRVASAPGKSGLISPRELRRATRQANVLGLRIDETQRDHTRGDLEGDFQSLCRRHRLPAPQVNVRIGPHLVDFLWREQRLVVETDSYGYHSGRAAFQDDRARDLDLRVRGFQVLRLSEKQVDEEALEVARVLRDALRVGADGS